MSSWMNRSVVGRPRVASSAGEGVPEGAALDDDRAVSLAGRIRFMSEHDDLGIGRPTDRGDRLEADRSPPDRTTPTGLSWTTSNGGRGFRQCGADPLHERVRVQSDARIDASRGRRSHPATAGCAWRDRASAGRIDPADTRRDGRGSRDPPRRTSRWPRTPRPGTGPVAFVPEAGQRCPALEQGGDGRRAHARRRGCPGRRPGTGLPARFRHSRPRRMGSIGTICIGALSATAPRRWRRECSRAPSDRAGFHARRAMLRSREWQLPRRSGWSGWRVGRGRSPFSPKASERSGPISA